MTYTMAQQRKHRGHMAVIKLGGISGEGESENKYITKKLGSDWGDTRYRN